MSFSVFSFSDISTFPAIACLLTKPTLLKDFLPGSFKINALTVATATVLGMTPIELVYSQKYIKHCKKCRNST